MARPVHKYCDFVSKVQFSKVGQKRYWLTLDIESSKTEGLSVILKNPSRADDLISDYTVNKVSKYVYRNRDRFPALNDIGKITILNLIPFFETHSHKLKDFNEPIIDKENIQTINEFSIKNNKVIIAWGDHPEKLYDDYEKLKNEISQILIKNKNDVFYVERYTNSGNPKHGQVWSYDDELVELKSMGFNDL